MKSEKTISAQIGAVKSAIVALGDMRPGHLSFQRRANGRNPRCYAQLSYTFKKQAVDGDTAQVGPEMAEHLGIPQITGALSLSYEDGKFVVVRENENYQLTLACAAPLLVTVTKSEKEPYVLSFCL